MSEQHADLIVSPDTTRLVRIPPNQVETAGWPVLHVGPTPSFDAESWVFGVFGLVEQPWQCGYAEFRSLPRVRVRADMHCVTSWSKLDNLWEGVSTREVMGKVRLRPEARFAIIHCEHGFTTNLPLADFLEEDCLFAWGHDGRDLTPDHGYPLRLVVPRLYAWKSAKWVRGVELAAEDRPGFWESWENGGYSLRGDPWKDQRFREDERLEGGAGASMFP
jgi:DMSO/TMAO reductase YedYZ molybdopterin-dependent catalytic subunit